MVSLSLSSQQRRDRMINGVLSVLLRFNERGRRRGWREVERERREG